MRNIRMNSSEVDEFVDIHILINRTTLAIGRDKADRVLPEVLIRLVASNKFDQFTQDCKFEFEFDRVDNALDKRLEDVEGRSFETEKAKVEDDDNGVYQNELLHDLPSVRLKRTAQDLHGLDDVYGGEDDFLTEEATHLYLLHDVVSSRC